MIQSAATPSEETVDAALRAELAQGDVVLRSVAPIMRHLLAGTRHAMFADEIVARVRGGMSDVARQLLDAVAQGSEPKAHDPAAIEVLIAALAEIPGFLGHVHALAVEWQLTERLQARLALDPTMPPLLQALLASKDAATSALAMNLLAAQARFAQAQRRMQLPLAELPADLLHGALQVMRALGGDGTKTEVAEATIRAAYDEGRSRLALIARLITGLGGGATAALSLSHAGMAIFATALSMASGLDRDVVMLSTSEGQSVRLGLALRAAGLQQGMIEEQLFTLHPDAPLPLDWNHVAPNRATAILAIAVSPAGA